MSCDCNEVAAEPTPRDNETHGEYMSRCMEAGYTEEECMAAHEGHTFEQEVEGYYDDEKKKKKGSNSFHATHSSTCNPYLFQCMVWPQWC